MGVARWFDYTADLEIPTNVLVDTALRRVVVRSALLAAITPWNYPVMEAACRIAPAQLAANAVVVKPSPYTPVSDLLVDLFAGISPTALSPRRSAETIWAPSSAKHPLVGKATFTGSTATGKDLRRRRAGL